MAKEKTVTLVDPIRGHEGEIKSLRFREPKFPDLIELGEPVTFARSEAGLVFSSERDDVLQAYSERLLVEPKDPAMLQQLGLADALQVKETIHGFFGEARERISNSSQTRSSST